MKSKRIFSMKNSTLAWMISLACLFGACSDAARQSSACVPGTTQACLCLGGSGVQACNASGTGFETCRCASDAGGTDVPALVDAVGPTSPETGTDVPSQPLDGYISDDDPPGVGGGSCDEEGPTIPGLVLAPGMCGRVSQGVCGGFSHAGKYAIDILVDPGTSLYAPVAGRVVGVRSSVHDSCSYGSRGGRDDLRTRGLCPSSEGTD